ncbi:MAG TPA: hypothetical protein VK179_15870 [Bacteroidales bacterium]|nr:hypothetical protein [Bacteroidales bacterium]
MKTFLLFIAAFFGGSFISPLAGQENQHSPVQVSFVYPLGTHGYKSTAYVFDFSFNILTGYTGGVDGFELGGLINMNKGNVSGFQAGGIANITSGDVSGFQAAGIYSMAKNLEGIQINGIFGKTDESGGVQISGITNVSKETHVAIAGISNINASRVNGLQIAGILNTTKSIDGVQIGLINIADSCKKGVSIGLVNIIRNRYFDEWSFDVADYMNLGISYHLGTKELYTIFSGGFNLVEEKLWVAGLGLGHVNQVSPSFSIRPEVVCYTYFPMTYVKPLRDTWIYHLRVAFVRDLGSRLAISAAPGFYISKKSNRGTEDEYGYSQSPIPDFFDVRPAGSSNKTAFGFGMELSVILK